MEHLLWARPTDGARQRWVTHNPYTQGNTDFLRNRHKTNYLERFLREESANCWDSRRGGYSPWPPLWGQALRRVSFSPLCDEYVFLTQQTGESRGVQGRVVSTEATGKVKGLLWITPGHQAKQFRLDSAVGEDLRQFLNWERSVIVSGVWKGHWHSIKHVPHIWSWELPWAEEDFSKATLINEQAPCSIERLHPGTQQPPGLMHAVGQGTAGEDGWSLGLPAVRRKDGHLSQEDTVSGLTSRLRPRLLWCLGWKIGCLSVFWILWLTQGIYKMFPCCPYWPIFLLFLTAPSGCDLW